MTADHLQHADQLRLESRRQLAIWATTLMLVPGILWSVVDASVATSPATLYTLHALRAFQLLLWVAAIAYIRRSPSPVALDRVLFLLALAIVAFSACVAWLRPATNWMPLRTFVLISIGTFVIYPYLFRLQLIAWFAMLAVVASLVFGHYASMPDYDRLSALLNILIAGVLGMLVARNRAQLDRALDASLEREREVIAERERAMDSLHRLEGLIPICAYCHQVRTEAGVWERLDQYVRSRTDADFSHGMCPACAKEHFPDIVDSACEQTSPVIERTRPSAESEFTRPAARSTIGT